MDPWRESSIDCVQKIIGRFKSDGLIENKSGRGRKSILSDVAKKKVLKDIKIDPKLSAVKLAAETSRIMGRSVSNETVRNVIRHAGYSSRVARKKPFQLHTPKQSPVIEHLWATLETAVPKHQIRNKALLKQQVLQEEWDKISPDTTKKLVESVPRRLENIIKAKGHATKY
ncbi:transposable element Tc1 transposase [Trichonephila clavipes]|nr:transposable element Tc1 transposase [Trichonephila clavipes]